MYPYFHLFGHVFPIFGIVMSTGIIMSIVLMYCVLKYSPFTDDDLITCALWAIILGMCGSKILYWITELKTLIQNPKAILSMLTSGLVLYGSLIGGIAGVLIFCKRRHFNFFQASDIMFCGFAIGQCIGRIGCHLAGCCYGVPTDSAIHVIFPAGIGSSAPVGIPLVPTQLYEAAFCGLLTILLVLLYKKRSPMGTTTYAYCILYGIFRFIIEFWRDDDRGFLGPLSTSQVCAIGFIAFGILLCILVRKGKLKPVSRETTAAETKTDSELSEAEPVEISAAAPLEENNARNTDTNIDQ